MGTVDGVLLLAAGKGERLKPITDKIPKPLIRIYDIPIIVFPLYFLAKADFKKIIVNLHHLPDELEEFLLKFGSKNSIEFIIIREKELLGTGGTIKHVFEKFGFSRILVINSDSVGDFDILGFVNDSQKFNSIAHILIYKDRSVGGIELQNEIYVNIKGEGKGGDYAFCGVHIVSRNILDFLGKKNTIPMCIVRDGYIPAIASGQNISYSIHNGLFSDAGTYERIDKIRAFPKSFFKEISDYFVLA